MQKRGGGEVWTKSEQRERWMILTSKSTDNKRETQIEEERAKQYTSKNIMRVTLNCGCDALSVVCRNETT